LCVLTKEKRPHAETIVNICHLQLTILYAVLTNFDPFQRQIKSYVHIYEQIRPYNGG